MGFCFWWKSVLMIVLLVLHLWGRCEELRFVHVLIHKSTSVDWQYLPLQAEPWNFAPSKTSSEQHLESMGSSRLWRLNPILLVWGKEPHLWVQKPFAFIFRKTEILVHFGFLNSFCHVFSHTDVSDFNVMMFHFQIVLEWEFSRGQTLSSGDFTLTVWEFSENSLKQMTATFQLTGIPRSRQTLWKTGKTGFPETCTLFSAKWF